VIMLLLFPPVLDALAAAAAAAASVAVVVEAVAVIQHALVLHLALGLQTMIVSMIIDSGAVVLVLVLVLLFLLPLLRPLVIALHPLVDHWIPWLSVVHRMRLESLSVNDNVSVWHASWKRKRSEEDEQSMSVHHQAWQHVMSVDG